MNNLLSVVIESDRLRQRPIRMTDAEDIYKYFTKNVTTYMDPQPTGDIKDIELFIKTSIEGLTEGSNLQLSILDKSTGEFLGCSGLHHADTDTPELGIWLKTDAHRMGFGKEAIEAIIEWAKEHVDHRYLIYPVDCQNIASSRIPIKNKGILAKSYEKENMGHVILNIDEYHIYKEQK